MLSRRTKHPRRSPLFRPRASRTAAHASAKPRVTSSIRKDLVNIPNLITMLRIVMIPVVAFFLSLQTPMACVMAVLAFSIAAISDFFDGYLARRLKLVSVTGKFLDPLADKLMVMAATVQLASMGWLDAWIPIVILARELAVQGLRQIAVAEGFVIAAGTGGKIKTALQLVGLVGLLIHYTYPIHIFGIETSMDFHFVGLVLLLMSVFFSLLSGFQYFRGFLKAIDTQPDSENATQS